MSPVIDQAAIGGAAPHAGLEERPMVRYAMRALDVAWFRRLTLRQKFLASFGLVLLLLGMSLVAILFYLARINSYVERHNRITIPAIVTAADMRGAALQMQLALQPLAKPGSSAARHDTLRHLATMESTVRDTLAFYRTAHSARTHPVLFGMLVAHDRAALADQEDLIMQQAAGLLDDLSVQWTALASAYSTARFRDAVALLDRLIDSSTSLMQIHTKIDVEMKSEGNLLLDQARLVILALVILLGVVIAGTYAMVSTQIAAPLRRLAGTADRVAHHDLAAEFDAWSADDEVGALARSLRAMLINLRERTRSLERKTRELESFSYTVAHDLKAPLREVEGFSSLLDRRLRGTPDGMDETARHYLEMIRASALRMTALIDDLLRYSRLEQQDLPRSDVPVQDLLGQILSDRQKAEDAAPPQVIIDIPFKTVWGEPTSIQQALINLVDNALKFSRNAEVRQITIGGTESERERVLWIQDTGIGFDSPKADRIFGLFERLHASRAYDGTGVGLAIVKLVMEKHGGRVWAESAPGKGSTFYLAFPRE